jgi:hypothetical protein
MDNQENLVLIGGVDTTRVYMEYGAYLKILRYGKAGSVDGTRGVLLGNIDDDGIHVQVALEALYTGDEGLEAPSFTSQSWSRINSESKEFYPNLKIIGQYSTHAGTDYDEMDFAMQHSFFNGILSILYVFDPIENTEAVYLYNKEFKKLNGMYLYDKCDNPIDLKLKDSITRPVNQEFEYRTKVLNKINKKLAAQNKVYAVVFILLVIAFIYLMFQHTELTNKYGEIDKNIKSMQMQLEQAKNTPAPTHTLTPVPTATPEPKATPKVTPAPTPKPTKKTS